MPPTHAHHRALVHAGGMTVQAVVPAEPSGLALIRRIGGTEHPAPGRWSASRRRTSISLTAPRLFGRSESRPGRTAEASIAVGDHADDVAVTVHVDGPARPTITVTSGWPVTPPRQLHRAPVHSIRRWLLSGRFSAGGLSVPVDATLDYHGLWRHGDDTHGWFVLDGAIDEGDRAKRRVQFSIELLAAGPDLRADERGAA